MKLSRASSYALHGAAHMAAVGEDRPLASQHIAAARGIPERFLTKVLKPLVTAQILRSVKGPNGGYRLAKPAAKITLLDIVEAVDGPIRGQSAPIGDGKDPLDARLEDICNNAADQVRRHLGKVRLSDLAGLK
jgi:Rrf2 family protein